MGNSPLLCCSSRFFIPFLLPVLAACTVFAQPQVQFPRSLMPDSLRSDERYENSRNPAWNPAIFATSIILGGAAVHYGRYVPLWNSYKTSFFFKENDRYALNQDKFLHAFGASLGGELAACSYELMGMQRDQAKLYGLTAALLLLSLAEVEDGHIGYLGFDRLDFGSDLLGAVYPIAQDQIPFLRSFTPKVSYHATGRKVSVSGQVLSGALSDHEGQTFWVGITIRDLLPAAWRSWWPSIVGVAIGRGVSDLSTDRAASFALIALDLDLRQLPAPAPWVRRAFDVLNYIHVPMPAIRISRGTIWYGLYF